MKHAAQQLGLKIEDLLIERNLRGMQTLKPFLPSGYLYRAAQLITSNIGKVFIVTGFPVNHTFETDGPVGAIALYQALIRLGCDPVLMCSPPLSNVLGMQWNVKTFATGPEKKNEINIELNACQPDLIISIEHSGRASDGAYYNMRGEDISQNVLHLDEWFVQASCPTISIGDGGNEMGMGKIDDGFDQLDIIPSTTTCSELILADVSNWGAYGLVAMIDYLTNQDVLSEFIPKPIFSASFRKWLGRRSY